MTDELATKRNLGIIYKISSSKYKKQRVQYNAIYSHANSVKQLFAKSKDS